jgi:hypothetical protein
MHMWWYEGAPSELGRDCSPLEPPLDETGPRGPRRRVLAELLHPGRRPGTVPVTAAEPAALASASAADR